VWLGPGEKFKIPGGRGGGGSNDGNFAAQNKGVEGKASLFCRGWGPAQKSFGKKKGLGAYKDLSPEQRSHEQHGKRAKSQVSEPTGPAGGGVLR